jgi:heme oxygenase
VPSACTARESLRRLTEIDHQRLHKVSAFADLVAGVLTLDDYKNLLLRLLCLHEAFEERLRPFQAHALFGWASAVPEEARSARLRRDLAALCVPDAVVGAAPRVALQPMAQAESALGCAWVIEGSALGGRMMAKLLAEQLGITASNGGAFFSPQGGQAARWSGCCDAVQACGREPEGRTRLQMGAYATMQVFAAWMEAAAIT